MRERVMKHQNGKINTKWVLRNLNPILLLVMLIIGIVSSFEGVLNGTILGYTQNLNAKNGRSLVV